MRSRKDILETNKFQWTKRLELLSLKITELTIEPATHEALMNDVKFIHKDILAYNQASPHLFKKINEALDKLEDEIILLSLPASNLGKQSDVDEIPPWIARNKPSAGRWSFFCCCQTPAIDDDTFEPKKHSLGV